LALVALVVLEEEMLRLVQQGPRVEIQDLE
jgi:hypothetical protein